MSGVTVRPAESSDLSALAQLHAEMQALHRENRPDQFKPVDLPALERALSARLADPTARVWVAEQAGVVVGFAVVLPHERLDGPVCFARRWWLLDQLGVAKGSRRRGVARRLVEQIAAQAAAEGVSSLELNSWSFNQAAHAAFRRLGFVPKIVRFELRPPSPAGPEEPTEG